MVIRFFFNDELTPIDSIVIKDGENYIVKPLLRVSRTERRLVVDDLDTDLRLIKENEWKDGSWLASLLGMILLPYDSSPLEGNMLPYSFEVALSSDVCERSIIIPDDVTIITDEKSIKRWKTAGVLSALVMCLTLLFIFLLIAFVSKRFLVCAIVYAFCVVAMVWIFRKKSKCVICRIMDKC